MAKSKKHQRTNNDLTFETSKKIKVQELAEELEIGDGTK